MAYLFHHHHSFYLVDHTLRHGVFCQIFTPNSTSRPVPVQTGPIKDYSATIDTTGKLHILTMPDATHIYYFCYDGNRCIKKMLLTTAPSDCLLSIPLIYCLHNTLYITYLMNEIGKNSYSLMYQNLDASIHTTLFTIPYEMTQVKGIVYNDQLYIFCILNEEHYYLKCIAISADNFDEQTYLDSPTPITDYNVCITPHKVHITYSLETHGKYQLLYFNTNEKQILTLCTTSTAPKAILFSYLDHLWLNAFIDRQMQCMLSIDEGVTFSNQTPCTLQHNLLRYTFISLTPHSLYATELYASINNNVHLNVISSIDFDSFHPTTTIPIELELYLEGLKISHIPLPEIVSPSPPPKPSRGTNHPSRPSRPPKPTKPSNEPTLESAKAAFMEELSSWELPPKL